MNVNHPSPERLSSLVACPRIIAWFKLCGMSDTQPIRHASWLMYTYSRRCTRCLRNFIWSGSSDSDGRLGSWSPASKMPSSCASESADPRSIQDIWSDLLAGSIISFNHRFSEVSSWLAFCRGSVVPVIRSQSQPSTSGGKCRERGCHSDISNNASIVPMLRIFDEVDLSCPNMRRVTNC